MATMHVFRCGTKALVLEQVSHWWVVSFGLSGAELIVSMQNGKQITFGVEDTGGDDGYAVEREFIEFVERCGRL